MTYAREQPNTSAAPTGNGMGPAREQPGNAFGVPAGNGSHWPTPQDAMDLARERDDARQQMFNELVAQLSKSGPGNRRSRRAARKKLAWLYARAGRDYQS